MEKRDYKKIYKDHYYPSKKEPVIIDIPEFQFLMIDGINAENSNKNFQESIQALFAFSFKIKFLAKNIMKKDYVVMPLEGLWLADNMDDFKNGNKEKWKWTLMIMQPDFITENEFDETKAILTKKVSSEIIDKLRLERFKEGLSCQIMHIGPFSEEYKNILKIHKKIKESKGNFDGKINLHHEIYLSDFRTCKPDKMKTVIRQPFNKQDYLY